MIRLSTRARATAHWILAASFALFGAWALGEWWSLLGTTSAGWRSLLVPFLAILGAISLTLREIEAARQGPKPVRLIRTRRG